MLFAGNKSYCYSNYYYYDDYVFVYNHFYCYYHYNYYVHDLDLQAWWDFVNTVTLSNIVSSEIIWPSDVILAFRLNQNSYISVTVLQY